MGRGLLILILLTSMGCRFRSMSVQEQQQSVTTGAYSSSPAPAWYSPEATGGAKTATKSGGLIADSFEVNPVLRGRLSEIEPTPTKPVNAPIEQQAPSTPLARIAAACPTIEPDVAEALTITDRPGRIARYESLIGRCPDSVDIWVWLGNDYAAERSYAKSRDAYQRALNLDPNNEEAKAGVARLDEGTEIK